MRTAAGQGPAMRAKFFDLAKAVSEVVGSPWAFLTAALGVVLWSLSGPLFGVSDTWQLVINTSTTIITFLMVFLIQSTQNRDAKAVHLKLDELICSLGAARLELVDVENSTDQELERHQREFARERRRADPDVARRTAHDDLAGRPSNRYAPRAGKP